MLGSHTVVIDQIRYNKGRILHTKGWRSSLASELVFAKFAPQKPIY